jgi:hypothetical protein
MKTGEAVALGLGGIVLYTLFAKASAVGTLNFYPASVKNIHFDGPTPVMRVGLAVQNTSNQKFVLRSLAGSLYSNNTLCGNAAFFTEQTILPNSQIILNIDIRLSFLGVVNEIIQAFQYNNFKKELEFEGYVNIDNYQVPLNIKYTVGR